MKLFNIFTLVCLMIIFSNAQDIKKLTERCLHGEYVSCTSVGVHYYNNKHLDTAEKYFKKACDGNEVQGCHNLAYLYHKQLGKKSKMITYYKKACSAKNAKSCANLGNIYAKGENSISVDKKEAKKYYKKACDLGLSFGCYKLQNFFPHSLKPLPKDAIKIMESVLIGNKKGLPKNAYDQLHQALDNRDRFKIEGNFYKAKTIEKLFGYRLFYYGLDGYDMLPGLNAVINTTPKKLASSIKKQYGISFAPQENGHVYVHKINKDRKIIIFPHKWEKTSVIVYAYVGP